MPKFTMTKAIDDGVRRFGFATGADGTEFYVPRAVMIHADIDEEDVGHNFTANISANFADKGGLDLIALPFDWDDTADDVIGDLEDAINRANDLLADLRLSDAG